jgi:predicted Zn-dependent protease
VNKNSWTLDQLKHHLSRQKEIKAWIISEEHTHRRERYFISDSSQLATDQDRNVHSRNLSLKLFVHLQKLGRQGEISKKLFTHLPLDKQIASAIEAAQQTDHEAWDLPKDIPSQIPTVTTADPKISEDIHQAMNVITQRVAKEVQIHRPSTFNSAELFISTHHRELHLSNGLQHRHSQSRVYLETAFSFTKTGSNGKKQSDEYLNTLWAVHLDQLPLEKLFQETAHCAEKSLDVVKPITGKYPVIVNSEVLSTLLNGQVSQLSAFNAYNSLPFIKPGSELIPQSRGDLLTITLDPTLDFGANTVALSEQGIVQSPLKLVQQNQVVATATDKQYGDYLKTPPTSSRGNLVIDPGLMTYEELTQSAPQVIEILQFSGLFADSNSGTFSSEIRLARLFDREKKTITYLKGGSLSGSIAENFRGLRLSKSRVNRAHFSSDSPHGQGYYGPEYALLSDVSIVG